jgi:hypothetical protein
MGQKLENYLFNSLLFKKSKTFILKDRKNFMPMGLPRKCQDYRGATFEPSEWNDGGQIQHNNNCYNYACNTRTDTFAQPGRGAGSQAALDCNSQSKGSKAD